MDSKLDIAFKPSISLDNDTTTLPEKSPPKDDAHSDIYLDSSYTRLIQMWGPAAEKLIASKIEHTTNVYHGNQNGLSHSYRPEPGGSYSSMTKGCCRSRKNTENQS